MAPRSEIPRAEIPGAETPRDTIEKGSKSFALAARIFPAEIREDAYRLYAWCRYCDDQIDGQIAGYFEAAPVSSQLQAEKILETLYAQTALALQNQAVDLPAFQALQEVSRRHHLPQGYAMDLLEGFRMDVSGERYPCIEDTLRYCYHVAGVVGLMMSWVMGVRDPETLERAMDLGIAFQLTNIARDILEDAAIDRVYLPLDWLDAACIPLTELEHARHRNALFTVASRLIRYAEPYYASAAIGITRLPLRSAWAIQSAYFIYRDIGLEILKRGPESLEHRVSTSKSRKLIRAVQAGGLIGFRKLRAPHAVKTPRAALWSMSPVHSEE